MSSPSLEVNKQSLVEGTREEIQHHTGLEWPARTCGAMRAIVWLGGAAPHKPPNDPRPESLSILCCCPWGHAQISFPTYAHPMHVLASQKITERFFRNPAKPADEDVAERAFLILEERIQLRYHCREDYITASKREFLQRTDVDSKGNKIIMTPDMCISFEVGLEAKQAGVKGRDDEKELGLSARSQQFKRTRMETPSSQPGSSSVPLGKIKRPHPGTLQAMTTLHCPYPSPGPSIPQITEPALE